MITKTSKKQKLKFKNFIELVEKGGRYQIMTSEGWQDVGNVYIKRNKDCYKLELENGSNLEGSADHLIEIYSSKYKDNNKIFNRVEVLDNSVWIRLKNIKKGDFIICKSGSSKVKSIKKTGTKDTYDLNVESKEHKYWSNDISSHNTGKTSIVDGLAQRIIEKKVPRTLTDKRVYILDLMNIVSGSKYRGMLEQRLKELLTELQNNKNIILFIDEFHTIIGAGAASGSLDIANIFKPALARGDIQVIGATTIDEYRKHIEKDGALERRFQKVLVEPTSPEDTIKILNNIKSVYEEHHNVIYTNEAIEACVKLTERYVIDRNLPDKAIDALDESGARVHINSIVVPKTIIDIEKKIIDIKDKKVDVVKNQNYEEAAKLRDTERKLNEDLEESKNKWDEEQKNNKQTVSESSVSEVVSMMSGIPLEKVSESENEKLMRMPEFLKGIVIGQDEAVDKMVKSIQRNRIGLKDPGRPIGVFLCCGESGTGKTFLAKNIAKYLFNSEDSLIRLDMSEYMEKIDMTKIIGSSPGYIGHEEGSAFLNDVRTKPYSVILLDEIEKAHPDISNLFLQIFDEGHMTDSHGRKISFKNTIIIMTSNIGVRKLRDFGSGIGFNTSSKEDNKHDHLKSTVEKEINKKFPPELINRIDDIIIFNSLTNENLEKILNLELNKFISRIESLEFKVKIDKSMTEYLISIGFDEKLGARPMKRTIQKWIEDPITSKIISDSPIKGSTFNLSYDKDKEETIIKITKGKKE